ncbi:DUF4198 domain-containing protein [Limnobacter humi]|uniref:DUF4198 domain-containing protein n=1 Tax=Limnobacter humi TaxID=1778671 RepID=A0ABT1WHF4_9BURK|nr:DUF4198 domain-containing protein [Limnobacter humi]MCQ8896938.1 DUF4198 domain-containing protein [Limnobacter humi]
MRYLRRRCIGLLLALNPLLFSCAMATEKVLLWPEIQGQILNAGKPVPELELTQTLFWNYEESKAPPRVVTLKTDTDGRFVFPKITGEISTGLLTQLLHQPGIGLGIDTQFDGRDIRVLASLRTSYGKSATSFLNCDLKNLELFDGRWSAICDLKKLNP